MKLLGLYVNKIKLIKPKKILITSGLSDFCSHTLETASHLDPKSCWRAILSDSSSPDIGALGEIFLIKNIVSKEINPNIAKLIP